MILQLQPKRYRKDNGTRLNTRLLLFCGLILPATVGTLLAPVVLRAQQTPDKNDVRQWYDRFAVGIRNKNIKTISDLMAPGMVNKDRSGKTLSREAALKTMQQELNELTKVQTAGFTVEKSAMQAGSMLVNATLHMTGSIADPQGKLHRIDQTSKTRDAWTKIGGKWLVSRSEDLPGGRTLLDGKPINAPNGG